MQKRIVAGIVGLWAVSSALMAAGGVFDDASLLLQGDCDVDQDGRLTQGEAINALAHGSAEALSLDVCGSVDGTEARQGLACPVERVYLPRRGQTVNSRVIRFKTWAAKSAYDGLDIVWASGLYKTENYPLAPQMTAVLRFRWAGFVKTADGAVLSTTATILNYGGFWASDNDGVILSIVKDTDSESAGRLRLEGTHVWWETPLRVEAGVWYDFALTAQTGEAKIRLVSAPEDDQSVCQTAECRTTTLKDAFAKSHFSLGMLVYRSGYNQFYPRDEWTTWRERENAEHCFNGDFHQIAFWNRVLGEAEIEEAFLGSASTLSLGVANGTSDEFAGTSSAPVGPQDGWHRAKGRLTQAGETLAVTFAAQEEGALSRVVRCKPCAGSAGVVALYLNGAKVGASQTVSGAHDVCWLLPGENLSAGANTVELKLLSAGVLALDMLEITGDFRMVVSDREVRGPRDLHLLDGNSYNFHGDLSAWATSEWTNRVFRFSLPLSVARRYDQQWTIRRSQWMGPLAGPFDVWANGQRVHLCETQMPETFSFVVPRTVLVDGLNRVVFRNLSEQTVDEDRQGYYLLEEIAVQPQRRLSSALLVR